MNTLPKEIFCSLEGRLCYQDACNLLKTCKDFLEPAMVQLEMLKNLFRSTRHEFTLLKDRFTFILPYFDGEAVNLPKCVLATVNTKTKSISIDTDEYTARQNNKCQFIVYLTHGQQTEKLDNDSLFSFLIFDAVTRNLPHKFHTPIENFHIEFPTTLKQLKNREQEIILQAVKILTAKPTSSWLSITSWIKTNF